MVGGIRKEDIVRNDGDGVHSDNGVVHKDYSVRIDGDDNHEKDMGSFTHLLFHSPYTL